MLRLSRRACLSLACSVVAGGAVIGAAPGPAAARTVPALAASTGTSTVTFTDGNTGHAFTCDASTIAITWTNDPLNPDRMGTIDSWKFLDDRSPLGWCTDSAGLVAKFEITGALPVLRGGASGTSKSGTADFAGFSVSMSDGCQATISGNNGYPIRMTWSYSGTTGKITFGNANSIYVQSANAYCDPIVVNVADNILFKPAYQLIP